jgi:protein SCO1/2
MTRLASSSLVTHTEESITPVTFGSRYLLIQFGYTYCPDICPMGLATLAQALRRLGDHADDLQPVFVTIDPMRDSAQRLAQYVDAFHPDMIGVTGHIDDIRQVAKAFGVKFMRAQIGEEVVVDHSAGTFLVGPNGDIVARFAHMTSPAKLADDIVAILVSG